MGASDGAVLAVDLGGTAIKGALVDVRGRTVRELVRPTPRGGGRSAIAALEAVVSSLSGEEPAVRVVSAVVPGVVDVAAGRIVFAGNLGLRDVAVRECLVALTGLETLVEHDVRAAGVAERTIGAARESRDHLVVVCGTGIAASVVSGRAVLGGAHGVAGEFGHIPVWPDGELCECGQRGCLERYASAAAIARRYVALGGEPGASARDVAGRLASDAAAARAWEEACEAMALGIAGAAALLDPELVVISGGLAEAGEALAAPVRERLTARLAWRSAVPELRCSPLGARAGMLGAAVLGWRHALGVSAAGGSAPGGGASGGGPSGGGPGGATADEGADLLRDWYSPILS